MISQTLNYCLAVVTAVLNLSPAKKKNNQRWQVNRMMPVWYTKFMNAFTHAWFTDYSRDCNIILLVERSKAYRKSRKLIMCLWDIHTIYMCTIILDKWDKKAAIALSCCNVLSPVRRHIIIRSNNIHHNVWDEITYPFLNLNGVTVEV